LICKINPISRQFSSSSACIIIIAFHLVFLALFSIVSGFSRTRKPRWGPFAAPLPRRMTIRYTTFNILDSR
jgi:hypothetical protein